MAGLVADDLLFLNLAEATTCSDAAASAQMSLTDACALHDRASIQPQWRADGIQPGQVSAHSRGKIRASMHDVNLCLVAFVLCLCRSKHSAGRAFTCCFATLYEDAVASAVVGKVRLARISHAVGGATGAPSRSCASTRPAARARTSAMCWSTSSFPAWRGRTTTRRAHRRYSTVQCNKMLILVTTAAELIDNVNFGEHVQEA